MVGILVSFWDTLFSVAMLVSGRVYGFNCIFLTSMGRLLGRVSSLGDFMATKNLTRGQFPIRSSPNTCQRLRKFSCRKNPQQKWWKGDTSPQKLRWQAGKITNFCFGRYIFHAWIFPFVRFSGVINIMMSRLQRGAMHLVTWKEVEMPFGW